MTPHRAARLAALAALCAAARLERRAARPARRLLHDRGGRERRARRHGQGDGPLHEPHEGRLPGPRAPPLPERVAQRPLDVARRAERAAEAAPTGGCRAKDAAHWGWSEIHRIALDDGTDLTPGLKYVSPDDGNPDDRTLASVPLPRPVAPGETLVFRVDWEAKFPRAVARTGWKDDYLLGAQWFPKLCAATDAGWNAHQFHAGTEFFADFGDYDVSLTLPKANKGHVGGTGVLKEETELAGDVVREHFLAEDVHDFAFAACPRFEVVKDTFSAKGLPNVDIVLLLQPDHRPLRDRYLKATKVGLEDFGTRYLPYPYPVVTVVDPPWGSHSEGMEYPTLFVGGGRELAPKAAQSPEGVTVHEYGHQVFYGMLASNEFEEAHLDEGFNTYATLKALEAAYGNPSLVVRFYGLPVTFAGVVVPYPFGVTDRFHRWEIASRSDAQAVPSYRQLDGNAIRNNAYLRTALLLRSCERTFGEAVWAKVMKTYATRFAFRHPDDGGLPRRREGGRGRERRGLRRRDRLDGGPGRLRRDVDRDARGVRPTGFSGEGSERKFEVAKKGATGTYVSTVVVQRFGEAVWPVDVVFTFRDGSTLTRPWTGVERWVRWKLRGPKLVSAEVDPARKCLLDGNTLNNGRRTEPDPRASRAWTARFMFWAQNLLETFSLLGFAADRMRRDSVLVLAARGVVSALETWKALLLALVFNLLLAYAFAHPVNAALRQVLDRSPWARAARRRRTRRSSSSTASSPGRGRTSSATCPRGTRSRPARKARAEAARRAPLSGVLTSTGVAGSAAGFALLAAALAAVLAGGFAGRFGSERDRGSLAAFGADAARFALPSLLLGALSLAGIAAACALGLRRDRPPLRARGPPLRVGGDPPRPRATRRVPPRRRRRPPRRPLHARRHGPRRHGRTCPARSGRPSASSRGARRAPSRSRSSSGRSASCRSSCGRSSAPSGTAGTAPPWPSSSSGSRRSSSSGSSPAPRTSAPRPRSSRARRTREAAAAAPTVASESEPARESGGATRRPRRDGSAGCARGRPPPGPSASSRPRTSRRSSRTTPSASCRRPCSRSRSSGRIRAWPASRTRSPPSPPRSCALPQGVARGEAPRRAALDETAQLVRRGAARGLPLRRRARARPRPPPRRRAHRGEEPRALRAAARAPDGRAPREVLWRARRGRGAARPGLPRPRAGARGRGGDGETPRRDARRRGRGARRGAPARDRRPRGAVSRQPKRTERIERDPRSKPVIGNVTASARPTRRTHRGSAASARNVGCARRPSAVSRAPREPRLVARLERPRRVRVEARGPVRRRSVAGAHPAERVPQVVREVPAREDQNAFVAQRGERAARRRRALAAPSADVERELDDRHFGPREHPVEDGPRAVVEAAAFRGRPARELRGAARERGISRAPDSASRRAPAENRRSRGSSPAGRRAS